MLHLIHPADQRRTENGTVSFEGRPYGAGVSFFLVDVAPGEGPDLHTHPYTEVWIVRSGRAAMTVGDKRIMAEAGDIIVVAPETPHGFKAAGDMRLNITCIHSSDHFIQEWVAKEAA